jgi:hypothetical protein
MKAGGRCIGRGTSIDWNGKARLRPDMAARIRKKPAKLIGFGLILFGTLILLKEISPF